MINITGTVIGGGAYFSVKAVPTIMKAVTSFIEDDPYYAVAIFVVGAVVILTKQGLDYFSQKAETEDTIYVSETNRKKILAEAKTNQAKVDAEAEKARENEAAKNAKIAADAAREQQYTAIFVKCMKDYESDKAAIKEICLRLPRPATY